MEDNEYRCASCGEIYKKGWSDSEAEKEYAEHFGREVSSSDEIVCDDCYQKIMAFNEGVVVLPDWQIKIRESLMFNGCAGTHTRKDENGIIHVDILSADETYEYLQKINNGEQLPDGITIEKL